VLAIAGGRLRAREVTALRRAGLDVLAFIPFTIILIIPLSPLGHVLVFGFIQRYFPSLFPSQFSSRRQQIMIRSAAAHLCICSPLPLLAYACHAVCLALAAAGVVALVQNCVTSSCYHIGTGLPHAGA
jgi:hypothetical protein